MVQEKGRITRRCPALVAAISYSAASWQAPPLGEVRSLMRTSIQVCTSSYTHPHLLLGPFPKRTRDGNVPTFSRREMCCRVYGTNVLRTFQSMIRAINENSRRSYRDSRYPNSGAAGRYQVPVSPERWLSHLATAS